MRLELPILASTLLALVPAARAQDATVVLEQVSGRGTKDLPVVSFRPEIERWSWAADGVHLTHGRGEEERWVDPGTMKESVPPEARGQTAAASSADGEAAGAADAALTALTRDLERLDGVDAKRASRIAGARGEVSADGSARLLVHGGELFFHRAGHGARRLPAHADHELLELSPDGAWASYVESGDLWVIDSASGRRRALTTSGDDEHLNGKLDWVYQEEIYGRGRFKAYWWSPDSKHIAFLYLDETDVNQFTVVDHIEKDTFRVKAEVTSYPKAGDPNPTVHLGLADPTTGSIAWPDLTSYAASEPLIVRVGWTPDGARCWYVVQDRIQTWAELNAADPASGATSTWIREESSSWTERPAPPRWLTDGSFLWESHRTGHTHLYHYRQGGELVRAITQGDWSVARVMEVDEAVGAMWFTATEAGAVNSNVYRIGLDGSGFQRLTQGAGTHSITFNKDRSLFIDRVSSLAHPGEVRLVTGGGELQKVLARATVPASATYSMASWELHEVEAQDGFLLDVALLKPVPFDPARTYPVFLPTYSGPDAPSVRNRWNSSGWYQFLAQNGVIVMQVNVRSASGKGHWALEQCYKQAGVSELKDLVTAVDWLTAHPWADASRVGITGYSYGGFMTAFALCASDRFALGIAGGGVYDWGMYDTIYTERYMSTPQLNPEGYAATSCLKRAKDLSGHLFMYHGVMDDNVHVQNMMQMAYALQKAGKDFEMMAYPQNRHGIRDAAQSWHVKQKTWALIRKYLLEQPAGL